MSDLLDKALAIGTFGLLGDLGLKSKKNKQHRRNNNMESLTSFMIEQALTPALTQVANDRNELKSLLVDLLTAINGGDKNIINSQVEKSKYFLKLYYKDHPQHYKTNMDKINSGIIS